MKVGVCDFPSKYSFPPHGYGGIERWLWAVAVGARQAGHEVHLIGPGWRKDVPAEFRRTPLRLEDAASSGAARHDLGALNLDLLVVGHEYPSLPAWRSTWEELGARVVTFQHDPNFRHAPEAFDGDRSTLFCYSPEMVELYAQHRPVQALSVQFGLGEERPPPAARGRDLVWIGRIDGQKAPHIAIEAARQLGRRIRLIGPVLDRGYAEAHADALGANHVDLAGEVAGRAKLDLLGEGAVMVYTCADNYVEAGAAVFGESLRCGTPVAALAWRSGTCAEVALCPRSGAVAHVGGLGDSQAAARLADTVRQVERLDARDVQETGLRRFDPRAHFDALRRADVA
ncbi:glycosyltransferase [Actinokineospora terrae]|uniref:Glycosyltransferase involved in cell wall bisynthesis n=1 Tax=Actinokineospora terrae TaxID=155974 RepID=A0A1H9XT55_9PSEU|nr:glycosyltransferase [Actinokineospora terrae]SES49331.1 Glycosyltransferase involved in cell wall bisynthesis [Actinokineospora terrae]